jgi:CDP-glucose 4,6-dehydratase
MNNVFGEFYNGKRILVTGHTGFKGSWLTEWLLMMGAKVTGLALPPPTVPALFDQLGLANRCDHRIGDIRDRDLVRRVVHEVRPDLVFHLAAQPLVRLSYSQPIETYETNVMGTAYVLDALRDADWPCAAVMITTDKVYENKEKEHAYQETDPLGGYDPYSSSKACAELVIQSYRNSFFNPARLQERISREVPKGEKRKGLVAVASARAGNVIGGGDWALDRIVPDCMRALARGEAIAVRNPNSTRPWQHVLEPLSGYLLLGMKLHGGLASDIPRLTSYAAPFNFGPSLSSNRSVSCLVEEILRHWAGRWVDRSDPKALHEAALLHLATDKACHILGWNPRWDFPRTLAETVLWYRKVNEGGGNVARELTQVQITRYVSEGVPSTF